MPRTATLIATTALLISQAPSLHAQTTIKLEKKNGVYMIPCKVNGLALKFIFDTGASDVSLSLTEAMFMLKNDYLSESDFTGTERYRVASGEIHEGYTLNLRRIEVGGKVLTNVKASIVKSSDAPLLLGQSALNRLGVFQFDYANNTLVILDKAGSYSPGSTATAPTASLSSEAAAIKDIDGNVYRTVRIGTQVWMAENLRTTRYRNGDQIPNVTDNSQWTLLSTGAWCNYENQASHDAVYGKLYNGHAVADSRGLCPQGWHAPTDTDWTTLVAILGGNDAGGKLKSKGATYWRAPNSGANNTSGFSGLPGGYRSSYNGNFSDIGIDCTWWNASESDAEYAWGRYLNSYNANVLRDYFNKRNGFYIRCVKD